MKHKAAVDIPEQMDHAVQLGIKAHLAFRRHSEARIHAIRDGSWLETTSQTILFRLQAEYDLLQEQYRKALHNLRKAAPDEYNLLLREIAQQIREEVNNAPFTTPPAPQEEQHAS